MLLFMIFLAVVTTPVITAKSSCAKLLFFDISYELPAGADRCYLVPLGESGLDINLDRVSGNYVNLVVEYCGVGDTAYKVESFENIKKDAKYFQEVYYHNDKCSNPDFVVLKFHNPTSSNAIFILTDNHQLERLYTGLAIFAFIGAIVLLINCRQGTYIVVLQNPTRTV